MGLRPTQGNERRLGPASPLYRTVTLSLSSRGADLPAASQEWNDRVDIEPLPIRERSCFVSGHDFSRAAHQGTDRASR